MLIDDLKPGVTYECDYDHNNEVWLVLHVINRIVGLEVNFVEYCLSGPLAGIESEASFRAFSDGHIGARFLGMAGQ